LSTLTKKFQDIGRRELLAVALVQMLYAAAPGSHYIWANMSDKSTVATQEFFSANDLLSWLLANDVIDTCPFPVLSFVCSLVLTRGLDLTRDDMDDCSAPSLECLAIARKN
jgi:hypothetical protein